MNGCSHYLVNYVLQASVSCFKHKGLLNMPKGKGARKAQQWVQKPKASSSCFEEPSSPETVAERLSRVGIAEATSQYFGPPTSPPQLQHESQSVPKPQRATWTAKSYTTASEPAIVDDNAQSTSKELESPDSGGVSRLLQGPLGANFNVDNRTYARAQIRATFYPKFENEKSDQEVRTRMIEMVSHGLATLEVSLKHSGSLFMYAGHEGGAYAKNSFGNMYTAVGVFVLGRTFVEAWGTKAVKKQAEFNNFLEENKMCISMELVTAVLGDHGQRPLQDYVVVTAVTDLGNGKPRFYSTPEIIAFCRKWRLPTNHVWLFSTRKSVTSFFAAYDALCEEGTATPVCKALDDVADISVPGTKDHVKVQGEILEGLVARVVSPDSSKRMEEVLKGFSLPDDTVDLDNESSLRDICAANRSNEKQQIKALLKFVGTAMCPDDADWFGDIKAGIPSRNADRSVLSKFLQAQPANLSTAKLQEVVRLMRQRNFSAAFKWYPNFHKVDSLSTDNLHFRMVIHVYNDSVFRRYHQEMRRNKGLWPLYRGFFVDVNLLKANNDKSSDLLEDSKADLNNMDGFSASSSDSLADEDANLMIKLKFLTYKLRTFLIRNGLATLFKDGPSAYKAYYLRQMKNWGTSPGKQRELSKMLDEWAVYITRKCGNKQLSGSTYLTKAEPFLEQFAKRSPQNQALVGSSGNLIRTEDFMAVVEGMDEEGDLVREETPPSSKTPPASDILPKKEGLIVFFPGIPGCAKSALCKELLSSPGGLGDERPMHSLMGDMIKGKYWQKVAEERKKKPYTITLADKNAPNEEVWKLIEDMCHSTRASAVPVVPESEGTTSNPFSLDALAVFIHRVLQRVNHPGNLDKSSPNAGYVLLMFYNLYEGKSRREFETELAERFGSVIRMPLLKADRKPLPDPVKLILEEGISLFRLHSNKHGRKEPSKGSYAREWSQWERRLREVIFKHAEFLNSIQVPFESSVAQVREQLKSAAKGEFTSPVATKRMFGNIVFAAVALPVDEINSCLDKIANQDAKAEGFLKDKDMTSTLKKAHVTLAHKRSHGVSNVASYGIFENQAVPVELTAFLFTDNMAAFEACLGSVDGEQVSCMNEWPHVTIWTGPGVTPKEANNLPLLVSAGKATRIDLKPAFPLYGVVVFY